MTTTPRVSILDLPIRAIKDIELAVGARMTEWPEGVKSLADLYARIYAAGTGRPLDEVEALSLRDLTDLVVLSEKDEDDADPT